MTNEEHIIGLKVIKPYLQNQMKKLNYEGLGEQDAYEIGETIDAAIEALQKQISKKPEINIRYSSGLVCPNCNSGFPKNEYIPFWLDCNRGSDDREGVYDFINVAKYCPICGQRIDWEEE